MTQIVAVGPERAGEVLTVIHGAFATRPELDPPATAMAETRETVAAALAENGGLLAVHEGQPVGALLFADRGRFLGLRRVGVLIEARRHGVAALLAEAAEEAARARGRAGLELEARAELPKTVGFWQRHGYVEVGRDGPRLLLRRTLPVEVALPSAEDTRGAGARFGALLRAGDVVILTGELGAGKTTFTQGLAEGLGVRGPITSPTFVIARVHPSLNGGPALVHVDAYRLGDAAELDDLDLDTDVDQAVTVVEWGAGLAEALAPDRLEVTLARGTGEDRMLRATAHGERWSGVELAAAAGAEPLA